MGGGRWAAYGGWYLTPPFASRQHLSQGQETVVSTVVGDYHFDSCFSLFGFVFVSVPLAAFFGRPFDLCIFKRFAYCFCAQIWPYLGICKILDIR